MKKRPPVQLHFPAPRLTAAQRKAWIRSRLAGYSYRQDAREAKRQEANRRRAAREAGSPREGGAGREPSEQLSIPSSLYRRVN